MNKPRTPFWGGLPDNSFFETNIRLSNNAKKIATMVAINHTVRNHKNPSIVNSGVLLNPPTVLNGFGLMIVHLKVAFKFHIRQFFKLC